MKKNGEGRLMKKASYMFLALIMAAAMTACGSKKEEAPQAEQTVAESEQAVQENAPDAAAQEQQAQEEAAKEEAAKEEAAVKEEAEKEPVTEEAGKPGKEEEQQEAEVIKKPEPAAEGSGEDKDKENKDKENKEKKKKESKKGSEEDASKGLEMLDGRMTFDGMELEFPIELEGMKLGNWKIEYRDVDDPDSRTLAPEEVVTAVMTNDAFSADDVTVVAEFGNYSNEEASLTDLPMTGIYLTKGKGKEGKEPVLPEVVLPGKLTWGSKDEEIRGLFGEASFSGSFFEMDFDHMYENGSYMIELGGMNDTGISYIVYCEE